MVESNRNKWVVLALLTLVYIFSFIDRQLLVILASRTYLRELKETIQ